MGSRRYNRSGMGRRPTRVFPHRQRPECCPGGLSSRISRVPFAFATWGLVLLSYYPYVIARPHSPADVIEQTIFHIIILLMAVAYAQVASLDPGTVPDSWTKHINLLDEDQRQRLPHCRKTCAPKPFRSHYCSHSRRLVLNMDHYCPWVMNTVGFYNRKFFLLFVLYAWLACVWCVFALGTRGAYLLPSDPDAVSPDTAPLADHITPGNLTSSPDATLQPMAASVDAETPGSAGVFAFKRRRPGFAQAAFEIITENMEKDRSNTGKQSSQSENVPPMLLGVPQLEAEAGPEAQIVGFFALIMDFCLSIALGILLFVHLKMVIANQTTINPNRHRTYDLGRLANVRQVFGVNPWLWLLPVYGDGPEGDGITWPKRKRNELRDFV